MASSEGVDQAFNENGPGCAAGGVAAGFRITGNELSDAACGDDFNGVAISVELFDGSDNAIACAVGLGCSGLGEVASGKLLEGSSGDADALEINGSDQEEEKGFPVTADGA